MSLMVLKIFLWVLKRVKTGTLSVPEFNEYLKEIRDSSYNSLVISAENCSSLK